MPGRPAQPNEWEWHPDDQGDSKSQSLDVFREKKVKKCWYRVQVEEIWVGRR